ncbi:MAG: Tic20 family protein [Cyanobacteria bacterium P01_E01_bin.6]
MVWRGNTTTLDRIFAALVYIVPLIRAMEFSQPLLRELPFLNVLLIPLLPLFVVYGQVARLFPFGLGDLVIFLALFFLVVRNERIRHFIRFNTMQALLISIILSIFSILWALIATILPLLGGTIIEDTIFNVLFLGAFAASIYSVFQSIRGKYAEIPKLSDYAYTHVRY